ncbi:MAG TPA: aminotransferase class I/II-fold pyridoxal phosphate-dependent enzyme, partial [Polyangiaceae bacterium]|nr:aminotransferase class I/II-fold pyridoxal phosphate-dependent enzyme [Polyangiaceae bacterium]
MGWRERLDWTMEAADGLKPVGLVHQVLGDGRLDGRQIDLPQGRVVNFGNCSYLGLETDERLKRGACEAVERFGVVFSSSRAYASLPLYEELEALLSELGGGWPVVVAPSTGVVHQAALPVLVEDGDAVCFDVMAHSTLHVTLPLLAARGIHCEPVPHDRIDVLERRARRLAEKHRRVFYLCDGVYSMHGDVANLDALLDVLDRTPALFAYVDDAHGVGWAGRHGAGVVLGERRLHPQMAVALSLNKAFAAGGGCLMLPEAELARRVFTCGGPLIFSGPLPPAQLGAAIASARIHLSPELAVLQRELRSRIELFDLLAATAGIECVVRTRSPIRFIELGSNERTSAVAAALLAAGFFVNVSVFPAVSRGHAGVRLMLTVNQTLEDVGRLVTELSQAVRR